MRLKNGKGVLGWPNLMLYSQDLREVWNDFTQGYSYGCGVHWNTTVGCDTITGLVRPDFRRLVKILG